MLVILYRSLTALAYGFYRFVVLPRRVRNGKEDPERVREKLGYTAAVRPKGRLIWFHAASVGESLSILRLVQEIQRHFPHLHILLTSGTRTSAQLIRKRFPQTVLHQYAPLDFSPCIDRFLAYWQPDGVCWVESELWPNTLAAIKGRGIPAVLINMRLSDRSLKRWQKLPGMLKALLGTFKIVLAQTQKLAGTLQHMGCANVLFKGNLKYASDIPDFPTALAKRLQSEAQARSMWLATSTHPGEEIQMIQAHQQVRAQHPEALLVLAPRHPHRTGDIQALLEKSGETFLLYSRWLQGQALAGESILLIDQIGVLPLFYGLCPVTFVGGTLVPHIGGHNMIEPLRQGSIPIFGPLYGNFIEIASEMLEAKVGIRIQGPDDLGTQLSALFTTPENRSPYLEHQRAFLADKQAVLSHILKAIQPTLDPLSGQEQQARAHADA
jgi:3-deoxy-D-manno-octulosonic-acid transferase